MGHPAKSGFTADIRAAVSSLMELAYQVRVEVVQLLSYFYKFLI